MDEKKIEDTKENVKKLPDLLRKMHLSAMASELESEMDDPNSDFLTFDERIEKIVMKEWNTRKTKKFNKLVKHAGLKYPGAFFDDTIYSPERKLDTQMIERLGSSTDWIDQGRNLLVTGICGSGKSYYVNALAISAMHKDRTVRYENATLLMNEMKRIEQLDDAEALYKELRELATVDILIIDDFGLTPLNIDECRRLFEILDTREARKSTIVVSQIPVSGWYELFKNETYADACLDRLTSKAYRLEFNGIDMRQTS